MRKIETIKEFDPISQISSNEIDEIIICTNAIYNIQKSNIDIYLENIENFLMMNTNMTSSMNESFMTEIIHIFII